MSLDYTAGCVNFRDVGEFINFILGQEVLPAGRLFRGGKIDFVEEHSQIGFAASIINLRRVRDSEKFKAAYFHFPISNDYEKYHTFDKIVRRWLNDVIGLLEEETLKYPVLIHCTSGKDRTGVVIAAILKIMGVPDEAIIEEYLLSNGEVKREWIEKALIGIGEPKEYFNRIQSLDKIVENLKGG
ncbi:MAG: tyrosine-protein phosphatase [Xenococcaceae cyanobacterium]